MKKIFFYSFFLMVIFPVIVSSNDQKVWHIKKTPALVNEINKILYPNQFSNKTDYEELASYYLKLANQGDEISQINLAVLYSNGKGVKQNYGEAAKWFKKAAEQGNHSAQASLAFIYDSGLGVLRSFYKAEYWYKKESKHKNGYAPTIFGLTRFNPSTGKIEQDYKQAGKWLKESAEKGDSVSQFKLGNMYEFGQGFSVNFKKALEWYEKSAKNGYDFAQYRLYNMYSSGRGGKLTTPKDAANIAISWCYKSANQGNIYAQTRMGEFYENGVPNILKKNYSEAARLYRMAATQGDPKAKYFLAILYSRGLGVSQNAADAGKWLKESAAQEYPDAVRDLKKVIFARENKNKASIDPKIIGVATIGFIALLSSMEDWDKPPKKNNSTPSSTNNSIEYKKCYEKLMGRMLECSIMLDEVDCQVGYFTGSSCVSSLQSEFSSHYTVGYYYCDPEYSNWYSKNLQDVIDKSCPSN